MQGPTIKQSSLGLLALALSPPRQTRLATALAIILRKPLAGVDELHDVDDLLAEHDGEADAGDDPRDGGVELVGAGELERAGGVGVGEERGGGDVGWVAGLEGGGFAGDGLEEGGGEEGRGERE